MPRPMSKNNAGEKAKDFGKSIKMLLKEIFHYKAFMIIAVLMAIISAVLVIKSPGYLSELVNQISYGIGVNSDNMQKLSEEIFNNLKSEQTSSDIQKMLEMDVSQTNIQSIMMETDISEEDKEMFKQFLQTMQTISITDEQNYLKVVLPEVKQLPISILNKLFVPQKIDDVTITVEDRLQLISLLENAGFDSFEQSDESETGKDETIMSEVNSMALNFKIPESLVPIFFKDVIIDNINITANDQYDFVTKLSTVTDEKNSTKILETLDEMPNSIQELVKPKMDMDKIKNITVILIVLYVVSALASYIQQLLMVIVSNNFAKDLRSRITKKINSLPLYFFDDHQSGDILSIVTNDVDTIAQNLNNSLATLITSSTLLIGSIIMMFVTNYIMALTAIGASLIGTFCSLLLISKSQKYFIQRQQELGLLNAHIEEVYSNINIVKSYNGREKERVKFEDLNERVKEANRKSQFMSGIMQPLMRFVGNLGYVCVCVVGSLLVVKNIITFGVIIAFITYVRLFTQPLSQIAQAMTNLQSVGAAGERVFEFLDAPNMPEQDSVKTLKKEDVKGKVDFENVVFTYHGNDKPTIKNFNASAKPQQKIAIVGPTGAGKTTIVNLLMKFYDIDSGDIKIDDISIKDLSRENVHDLFTMVLQDTWIYDGSVMDNIKYNIKDVPDEKVKEICKEIGLDHFINTLPNGYDTVLNENDSVSVGQRQLLTIARGMIENAPILILDEATSNVDTRTEELVQEAMDKLSEGKTSFIIAHRLSTIKNADLILVINEGNIVEQGTHDELLQQNGFYAKLYNSQFDLDDSNNMID